MATVEQLAGEDPASRDVGAPDGRRDGPAGTVQLTGGPSVLFERVRTPELGAAPACFRDLNLDQAVDAITARHEEYNLEPIFYTPLRNAQTIVYRQEVMRDVERQDISLCVERFAERMRRMRADRHLIEKLDYKRQQEVWYLEAVATYCEGVRDLSDGLREAAPDSRGLRAICAYLTEYVRSGKFLALVGETEKLRVELGEVRYTMTLKGSSIRVSDHEPDDADYGAQIERTFERFKQGAAKHHRASYASLKRMDHVEAAVLEFVTRFHPDLFAELEKYRETHSEFVDATLGRFDREIQFYVAYHAYTEPIKAAGLEFCYPEVSERKEVGAKATFDLPLAHKLAEEKTEVITNDWQLAGGERIFVVSGPNQGGKTTFARTFGQLHYLARIGCPVPGSQARLLLYDQLLTHFEKQEDLSDRHGKLEGDLIRVHEILERASTRTIVVMNESFTSTTLDDARFLGAEVLKRMIALDAIGVYVTFVDELASLGQSIVSATSTVDEHNPTIRTFKIARRPADGLAYAAALAEKYRLTYEALRERVAS
jgi:DNA mismatch repair protein MutS